MDSTQCNTHRGKPIAQLTDFELDLARYTCPPDDPQRAPLSAEHWRRRVARIAKDEAARQKLQKERRQIIVAMWAWVAAFRRRADGPLRCGKRGGRMSAPVPHRDEAAVTA